MYMSIPEGEEDTPVVLEGGPLQVGVGAWVGIAVCLVVTLAVGIVPDTVLDPAEKATPALVQVAEPNGQPTADLGTGGVGSGGVGTGDAGSGG